MKHSYICPQTNETQLTSGELMFLNVVVSVQDDGIPAVGIIGDAPKRKDYQPF